jgi:type VI secretion system secreted protein Hcp
MFLKLDGIQGECPDQDHSEEIDILSYSISMHMSSSMGGHSTGHGTGQVSVGDLVITKYIDKATPTCKQKICAGEHIAKAELSINTQMGESEKLEYLKYTFEKVLITGISTGGHNSHERPQETITFSFAKMEEKYQEQGEDGKKKGGPVTFKRDLQKNIAA